ncbi:N-acetylglucosamine kinase [Actinokineospora enzanensis]|uniref:N-acetylglucosamine kinase n=1 Tax=Actinokineospora enzanensis TaxID=155975 RepID=UPI0003815782|nr:BadF/BadG/BcrA/BcrD ATPase family protein [Actinokineospora enzanensis]
MSGVALGIDAGGSTTRALAVDAAGTVVGRGRAGGANPVSVAPAVAADNILTAAREALGGRPLAACVIGLAGYSALGSPPVAAAFRPVFAILRPRVVVDAEVAFASGTASPDGTVLIAGTGSIAIRLVGRARVATAGGYGWLLGDEGSAFWIGREAVRATLRTLQGQEPMGVLAASVLGALGYPQPSYPQSPDSSTGGEIALDSSEGLHNLASNRSRDLAGEPTGTGEDHELLAAATLFGMVIAAVRRDEPVRLARFSPLVTAAAHTDPVAAGIVERAARSLAGQVSSVYVDGPVVLVGGVLRTLVGDRVRELLADREVVGAEDGAVGAAWLAALDAFGADAARPR